MAVPLGSVSPNVVAGGVGLDDPARSTAAGGHVVEGANFDPRLLDKPDKFLGDPEEWRQWRLTFKSWIIGVNGKYEGPLQEAEEASAPILSFHPASTSMDRFLKHQLISLTRNDALELVVDSPTGFEAWRQLTIEHDKLVGNRRLLKLEDVLHPQLGGSDGWRTR